MNVNATGHIKVEITIPTSSTYGTDWNMGDAMEQIRKDALLKLERALETLGGKVVGTPVVTLVLHEVRR